MTGRLTPFLVALARDPELYAAWIRQPEAVMVWAGLDAEDRAVLHSQDQDRIYQSLFVKPPTLASPTYGVGTPVAAPSTTGVYYGSYAYPPVTVTVPPSSSQPTSATTSCA